MIDPMLGDVTFIDESSAHRASHQDSFERDDVDEEEKYNHQAGDARSTSQNASRPGPPATANSLTPRYALDSEFPNDRVLPDRGTPLTANSPTTVHSLSRHDSRKSMQSLGTTSALSELGLTEIDDTRHDSTNSEIIIRRRLAARRRYLASRRHARERDFARRRLIARR